MLFDTLSPIFFSDFPILHAIKVTCSLILLGVVAPEPVDCLFMEMQDVCGHLVKEAPVMGDNQQSGWPALEIVLEPDYSLHVQHIDGLIQ